MIREYEAYLPDGSRCLIEYRNSSKEEKIKRNSRYGKLVTEIYKDRIIEYAKCVPSFKRKDIEDEEA